MSDNPELTVRLAADEWVLRRDGGDVQVGRRTGGEVVWLDDVDAGLFSGAAAEALDRGDADDEALLTAVRGLAAAEVERGG